MTTFTSEDREAIEKGLEFFDQLKGEASPPHIVDSGASTGFYTTQEVKFSFPPQPIGWWVLPGGDTSCQVKFSAHKQPRWLTKVMMKYIFEWEWEDVSK